MTSVTRHYPTIRLAKITDAGEICTIYNYYIDNTTTTFEETPVATIDMSARIDACIPEDSWWVAELEQKITGYAYATPWKPRAAYRNTVEVTVYIAPGHERRGIASALYQQLFQTLKNKGLHCALAGIALPNEASVALHESLGFRKVGELEEVGFKFGKWINVGYWELRL